MKTVKNKVFKKLEKVLITSLLMLTVSFSIIAQNTITVVGNVKDLSGESLPGVTVVVKGTTQGTVTDADGKYSISNVSSESTLIFSFIGMETQEKIVGNKSTINVSMVEKSVRLDEVVAVGYGTQRKGNVTGAVSTVKSEDLVRVPTTSPANVLGGKMPGLISIQRSGQPGADAASLSIRGFGNALVIVDGVETGFNRIDPNQIESISILKDGSASIYGSRAGNGVILVTTKRGDTSKPVISLNSSYSRVGITRMPEMVSSGQYAEIMREKHIQSGLPVETAPYTTEEIQKYYDGTDPQYPNTNWRKELTRNNAPLHQHNLSIRGGSEAVKFFGSLGYMNQKTMWTQSGGNYDNYNLKSNIDAKITNNLSLQLDLAARVEDRSFSARGWGAGHSSTIWGDLWNTSPTAPRSHPDPTKPVAAHWKQEIAGVNITSNKDLWGYNNNENEYLSGTFRLNYQFKSIKGLSSKFSMNYMKNSGTQSNFNKAVKVYDYDYDSDTYYVTAELVETSLNKVKNSDRTITGQLSLNYENTFGDDHYVAGFIMYEGIDSKSEWMRARRSGFLTTAIDQLFAGSADGMISDGAAGEMGRASYISRLNYNYKHKYLLETTFRADASAKFSKENRWGYFPSVSLGWRISEEFFLNSVSFLNDLKLRASYGSSGRDAVGNFQYLAGYGFTGDFIFQGNTLEQGLGSTGLANPNLTWEEIKIYNVGLDFELFDRNLYGEAEVFYRERSGIPANRLATLPISFGANLPPENINSLNDRGIELMLGTAGNINDFSWDLSGMVSWSRAKWDHFEEPEYEDPDDIRIKKNSGNWTDRRFGYITDGLFTSQEEIDALEYNQDNRDNVTLRPGDIRYVDVNGDGIIDWRDQQEIAKGNSPHWMVGLNSNMRYKDFDLSFQFQGALGHSVRVNLNPIDNVPPVQLYELRWTEENNDRNALVPRLGGSGLNNWESDYRLKSASYVRLKQLSFGYNIPNHLLEKIGFSRLRVYFAGTNLFTIDKLSKFGIDPEMPEVNAGLYYPQPKTYALGVNLSF